MKEGHRIETVARRMNLVSRCARVHQCDCLAVLLLQKSSTWPLHCKTARRQTGVLVLLVLVLLFAVLVLFLACLDGSSCLPLMCTCANTRLCPSVNTAATTTTYTTNKKQVRKFADCMFKGTRTRAGARARSNPVSSVSQF